MADQGQGQDQHPAEQLPHTPGDPPFLRVVRGDATAEEIAALTATLMAVAAARSQSAGPAQQEPVRSNWNAPARLLRAPVHPAAGGWRRSALP
ncbi:MAG TPA: acyl-CoA carboxylase subunit epsilon [Trebonia sp.]|nr:acyl-CoA carboxylase subunit epsilon [Trebonia sp.]